MLASKFGDIVVTREVKIETSPRGEDGPRGGGDDEEQLWSPADDAEWLARGGSVGENGGYPTKRVPARAPVWPLVPLGTVESRVTAKHDDEPILLETIIVKPDGRKWI